MADILTPGEKVSLERARDLVKRRQAVGCLDVAVLVGAVDALVRRIEARRPDVLICSACGTEACASGVLMCDAARTAALRYRRELEADDGG